MKNALLLLLALISMHSYAQEAPAQFDGHNWEAPYHLPIPRDWTIERFLIPISFAPQITYKGVEDIRFTPGWADQKSDEYWTYAFLWYLDSRPEMNAGIIAANLKNYYAGLVQVNTDSATAAKEKAFPVVTSFKKIKTIKGDMQTYSGTIVMRDYMTRMPITLNCLVHMKYCDEAKKTILFYELSPKPLAHNVWSGLNQLWSDFKCKKN